MKKHILFALLAATILPSIARAQNAAFPDATFTEYFRRETGWTAGDATLSIPLPDGRVLWLFGDSYIDNYNASDNSLPCLFQVRNAAMVQDMNDPDQMTTLLDYSQSGVNRTLFKLSNTELPQTYFWPGHGYVKGDTVYVFLQRYNATLAFLGTYVAKLTLPDLQISSISPLPPMNGLVMGRWVYDPPGNPYVYVYGNKVNGFIFEPYVARVPADNPFGQWEFRTANGWSNDPQAAVKISDKAVSPGFSVVKHQGKFYLITQQIGFLQCGLGREIYVYAGSNKPYGPFNEKKTVYTITDQYNGLYLMTYNAYAHPEWTQEGELLISYNVNDHVDTEEPYVCPSQCVNVFTSRRDADTYRPKFIRLPWSALTGNGMAQNNGNGVAMARENSNMGEMLSVRCYPNPAKDKINIVMTNLIPQVCKVQIRDLAGKLLLAVEEEVNEPEHLVSMDIAALAPGIYLVEVRTAEGVEVQKIVVSDRH